MPSHLIYVSIYITIYENNFYNFQNKLLRMKILFHVRLFRLVKWYHDLLSILFMIETMKEKINDLNWLNTKLIKRDV